ncbi:PAS domain S-box protein [Fusibacter paucivorans]|uniref:Stage 0 sporulation protein A homolog n=1 Tax=Fusibacter paucivorans TaxID=76009 RepID=A0ABS5PLX6_9FIRM|nr:PAS domain S-box protein [Fusibacter paucivorans]MBS7526169.1 PAS domain S-box protein [Fusibacter paucivorans]
MKHFDEDVFKQILDNMLSIVIVVSPVGKIRYANHLAVAFYEYSLDELLAMTVFDLRPTDAYGMIKAQLNEALETGIAFETYHQKRSGIMAPVKVRSIHGPDVGQRFTISVITDLSKTVLHREQSKLFEASLNIAEEAIITLDAQARITRCNRATEKILGYQEAELINQPANILIPEEKLSEFEMIMRLLPLCKAICRIETKRLHKSGHLIPLSVSYTTVQNQNDLVAGYVGIYSDTTEIRAMKDALKQMQERALVALEGGNFSVLDIELINGETAIFNSMDHLLGYSEKDIDKTCEAWRALVHPDDLERIRSTFKSQLASGGDIVYEFRILSKHNGYRWMRTKGKVYNYNTFGMPMRIIGTNEDITDYKEIEEALIKNNEEMKALTTEMERANQAKSLFLANMSHEIRTPLNGIISAVQLLKKSGCYDPDQQKLMAILETSATTLKSIVSDILDMTKAEQSGIKLNCVPFSMKLLMLDVFNELQLGANEKGLEVGYYFDPSIQADVLGDPQKFKQVLGNIIANAVKFTSDGRITLKTKCMQRSKHQMMIGIEIEDTGIGIPDGRLAEVFDPFMQVDESMSKAFRGTGLGLAIAKQYIEAMKGNIKCESRLSRGSKFTITCPFEISMEKNDVLVRDFHLEQSNFKMRYDQKKILSVDDSSINQNVMEIIIAKMGYQLYKAYHAEEALQILNEHAIDLILMDIQLPGINGYELTEQIKQNVKTRRIPVIAMTAYARREDREACKTAGMIDFITKPIDVDILVKKINSYMMD